MKRILWALAAIIIPAFVLWGAGSLSERRNYAGIIFGNRVPINDYGNAWEAAKNEALMTYGSKFYEIADRLDLYDQAWERLIMLKEARRKRIKVTDKEVRAFIGSITFFLDKNGSFDQKRYHVILHNTFRRDARRFEEDVRESLMIAKLVQEVIAGITVSDEELEEALAKMAEDEETKDEDTKDEGRETKDEIKIEAKRQRVKNNLFVQKRVSAIQKWRDDLFQRAALVDNITRPEKPEEEVSQKESSQEPPLE